MSAGHTVTIVSADQHVEVRIGGTLLAQSDEALRLEETGLPPRFYVPKDDVVMAELRPTTFHTACPFKGEASYWSTTVDGVAYDGVAWSYETPLDSASAIAGYLSFYTDRAEVLVDGARVS